MRRIGICALALTLTLAEADAACAPPEAGSPRAPAVTPSMVYRVGGSGRLQFFTSPDPRCPMTDVFVIPGDELAVYALTDDGWASVMYLRNAMPVGWVRADRLKPTGGALGPP